MKFSNNHIQLLNKQNVVLKSAIVKQIKQYIYEVGPKECPHDTLSVNLNNL